MRATLVLWSSFVLLACAAVATQGDPAPTTAAEATVEPATPAAVAGIDTELLGLAKDAKGVERMKLRASADGRVVKLSVYHHDESRIPAPVRKLAAAKFPGAKTKIYESELYADEGRAYEVELEGKDASCEVSATIEGELRYTECEIVAAKLPAPVTKAVEALLPGGKIVEAEHKKATEAETYSVEVELDGREHYLIYAPDGALQEHLLSIPAVIEIAVG